MKRNNKFYQEKHLAQKPKPHGQSSMVAKQICTPDPVPTVGDGNIS